ncbi:MAG: choice-of-anchor D domain-containing protein [Burkholderiales bacterium]|nr:choice-of-anchor D domain-containing protein [Burkholderiales bacterium]
MHIKRRALLVGALGAGILLELVTGASSAYAADALNGKSLYLNGPKSGGTSCTACHGASPADNVNGILRGANNPSVISSAWAQNKGGMGSLYNNKFSQSEIADLAAFIGNPSVVAGPVATVSPGSLVFNGTTIGQNSAALSATVSNTGAGSLTISAISLSGNDAGDFSLSGGSCNSGTTLAPSATCTVQTIFQPKAQGTRTANIDINHNGTGGISQISLSGVGNVVAQPNVAVSATNLNFGAVLVNAASAVQTITISNSGQAPLSLTSINLAGVNSGIFVAGGSCDVKNPIAAGSQCSLTLKATPTSVGAFTAALNIGTNASNGNVVVSLTGTGAAASPALSATPSTLAFGMQSVGSNPSTQQVSLSNNGNVTLNLTSLKISGSSAIAIGAGNTCGTSLVVGASCTVPIVFTPAVEGDISASLNISSNAPVLQVPITGKASNLAVAKPQLSDTGTIQFSDTQIGTISAKHTTTLTNAGTSAFKISSVVLSGTQPGDFSLSGSCVANLVVSPNAGCTIDMSFQPAGAGNKSADLLVVTDGGTQLNLHMTGTGVAIPVKSIALTITPQSFDFGSSNVGGSGVTKRFTLSNPSTSAISLSNASFSGPFSAVVDSTSCPQFPFSLAPMTSCELVVNYAPALLGAANGSVLISSGDSNATWTISFAGNALAGNGATPGNNVVSNQGGGGCSVARNGKDPMLPILVILAGIVIVWRKRQTRRTARAD